MKEQLEPLITECKKLNKHLSIIRAEFEISRKRLGEASTNAQAAKAKLNEEIKKLTGEVA